MMNKGVLVFTFVLITLEASRSIENRNNTVAKVNLFNNLNRQLHNISTTLFKSLKLDKNFTNINKNNTLIKMADDLIKLSETKFKMYREIHNATKTEVDNKAINALFNLTQVIEEIFKEEHYFLRNNNLLRSDSLIGFYEAVVSNSNWLEKSLIDWENADNNTYIEYRRRGSAKVSRRKYQDKINEFISRRRMDDLLPWRAPNQTSLLTRRIFGSHPARIKKYPFVASLLLMGEFVCAACIISKDMVLTAASCLQLAYKNPSFFDKRDAVAVRVGSDFPNKGGEVTPITAVYFHSKYDPVYLYNNLAIGRLESSLNFIRAKKRVRRIEYDRAQGPIPEKTSITLLGWGDQTNNNTYSGPLTMALLETYTLSACQKIYPPQYVTKTDFCAGFVDVGTGACHRDVGGPGFVGSYLVGVVNFGSPMCGTPNGPTVFTKIGSYASWIDSILAKVRHENVKLETTPALKQRKKHKPFLARTQKQKKSAIEKSALELLTTIFHDLKLDILFNATFNYEDEQPNEKSQNTIFNLNGALPDSEYLKFWEQPKYEKEAVIMPIQEPTSTIRTTTTSYSEVTESVLADLLTIPHQNDLDPEILSQLVAIKRIIDPIFMTKTQSPNRFTKYKPTKDRAIKSTAIIYDEPTTKLFTHSTQFIENKIRANIEDDSLDTSISLSDKDQSETHAFDKNPVQDILKNWDVSTNEVLGKSDSYEEKNYEKRRLTRTTTRLTDRKMRFRVEDNDFPETKVVRTDIKLSIDKSENQDSSKVKAMILTAVDTNVRERNLEHYQISEEGNWDDEPTRRLLDYVNI